MMYGIVDPLGAFRTIGIIQVAETQDEGGILVKNFLPNQYKCIEAHLMALEIIKRANLSASEFGAYINNEEEYKLLQEVLK